jgi:hypothetical protein
MQRHIIVFLRGVIEMGGDGKEDVVLRYRELGGRRVVVYGPCPGVRKWDIGEGIKIWSGSLNSYLNCAGPGTPPWNKSDDGLENNFKEGQVRKPLKRNLQGDSIE